jgi:hypothetical protein
LCIKCSVSAFTTERGGIEGGRRPQRQGEEDRVTLGITLMILSDFWKFSKKSEIEVLQFS